LVGTQHIGLTIAFHLTRPVRFWCNRAVLATSRTGDRLMQRMYAWALPAYALVITGLVFFPGWPVQQQIAAESTRLPARPDAASKAGPPSAEAAAANHANYPIPAPAKTPKHLFHLVIRYEGDGLIDQNTVDVCKSCGLVQASQGEPKKTCDKPGPAKSAGANLFHFIVRYEGDGLIDNNVVDLVKAYLSAANDQQDEGKKPEASSPTAPPASKPADAPQP
jgi:hypothetical protein